MLKAVAFDLDDTIYSHKEFEYSAFSKISEIVKKHYGFDNDLFYQNLVTLFKNGEKIKTFDKAILKTIGHIPENWGNFVIEKILPVYRNHKPKLKPFKDILNLIYFFKKNNIKTSLITNGNSQIQNNKIDCLGIRNLFDYIYLSDEFNPPARKPSLVMFNKLLSDNKLKGKECMYIGNDIEKDGVCEKLNITFIKIINRE